MINKIAKTNLSQEKINLVATYYLQQSAYSFKELKHKEEIEDLINYLNNLPPKWAKEICTYSLFNSEK